jgi:hypothetical protein
MTQIATKMAGVSQTNVEYLKNLRQYLLAIRPTIGCEKVRQE